MMKSKHYLHGGDLDTVVRTTGFKREELIDFSGNINPFGVSPEATQAIQNQTHLISTYPDRYYTELKHVVGKYCGTKSEHIIVGNGCSELISLVIQTLYPQKTLVLAPTYSEYEREVQAIGGTLDYHILKEEQDFQLNIEELLEQLDVTYDLLVICNPNNPTSTVLTQEQLICIVSHCKAKDIFVMVDETYIEFCDAVDIVCSIPLVDTYSNLMVLRGISKFFSAPGLRFGYGITSNEHLKHQLHLKQIPWSVNSLAEIAVKAMIQDQEYIDRTYNFFVEERARIIEILKQLKDLNMYNPAANFVLLKIKNKQVTGPEICKRFLKQGMIIRDASSFVSLDESYIRFCFLDSKSNNLLLEELTSLLEV